MLSSSTSSPTITFFQYPKKVLILLITLFLASVIDFLAKINQYFSNFIKSKTHKKKTRSYYKLPPGPKPWPLLGNLPEMLVNTAHQPAFRWVHGLMTKYDTDIACIRLGNVHVIPVTSPKIAREFVRKHDSSFASRPLTMTAEFSSGGYLATALVPEGEQWRKMRKLLSAHVINPSKLHMLSSTRDQEANNLVRFVYNHCLQDSDSKPLIDIRFVTRQYCGNVIRKMLFGKRYFGQGRGDGGPGVEEIEHVESAFRVLEHLYAFSPSDYVPHLGSLDLDGHGKIVKEGMRNIKKYQDPIIDERVKLWRDGKRSEAKDMLDFFILAKDSNGEHLTIEEIKAQCAELVLATVDNPSHIVEWTLAEMINQPKILHKAVDEIDSIVGKERFVQEFDLPSLWYVKACVREAFRLHPVAPFILPHVSTEDCIVSGYFIPKGSHVLLSRLGLGRNSKVWKEPSTFNPDRHLKDDSVQVKITDPDLNFISFGTGRRGCIGVALGSTMTLMLLTRLLQGFSWNIPSSKIQIDFTESTNDLLLKYPLHALASPRLPSALYSLNET